jgi:cytochrome b pre-mRNA-processing protein 3
MKFPSFRRAAPDDTISTLYGMIVAQARLPVFYRDYGVADTVNGRFDLIVLHLALVLGRMMPDPALKVLGQRLFDRFCDDMDDNLREIGISDLKVPKEMQRIGEAYYGRAQAYDAALAAADDGRALSEALSRNIYAGKPPEPAAVPRLAAYIRDAVRGLTGQDLARGALRFPEPLPIAAKSL